jgi:hypothetical protein
MSLGLRVDGGRVLVKFPKRRIIAKILRWMFGREEENARIAVRLTGIRKGFDGLRFPNRTKEQYESNERFLKSSQPESQR